MSESRRYHIRETLGRGGFGTVYRADLVASGDFAKPVALKVLRDNIEELDDVTRRLRDEARMLGLLRHRAIVQVDGLVMLNGRWAIVMEYVEGVAIRDILKQHPIPLGAALEVTAEVAGALNAAYARPTRSGEALRLLHRDIKPANIQLTPNGEVKVLDFGVARAEFDSREAETQAIMLGTFPYMSPERLDLIDTHKGDMYALGVLLYEMVVGAPFGKTSSNVEKHERKIADALTDIRRITQAPAVIQLLSDALAYDPDQRPDAEEFERRARDLRKRVTGPWLSDWASKVVPQLLEHREKLSDDLSGVTLIEQTDNSFRSATGLPAVDAEVGVDDSEMTESRPRRGWPLLLAFVLSLGPLAGGVLVALAVIVVGAAYVVMPSLIPAEPPAPAAVAPAPAPEPEPAPEPVKAKKAKKAKADRPKAKKTRQPRPAAARPKPPPAPEPEPEPDPASTGLIVVNGDATRVLLVGGGKAFPPGKVPAGTYQIQANFPGTAAVEAGQVTVAAGGTIEVTCKSSFQRCR